MEPELIDLVRELREALGLFDGAMPCSPREAWNDALAEVARLRRSYRRAVFKREVTR